MTGGHRLCGGCGAGIAVRQVLQNANSPVVCAVATGCLEVSTTIYPYTAWKTSYIHNAFENAAATLSGVETAYRALKKRGKIKADQDFKFVAWGGDGGTYDIGFQSLSGALERGHNMVYVCYNNEAYMNTGIQRSSATPLGGWTTTTPVGSVIPGKRERQKDLTAAVVAHDIPYVAQASVGNFKDLMKKAEKAINVEGPAFLNVFSPCPRGWRYPADQTIQIAKLASETCFWPLYEVEDGEWGLTYKPRNKKPMVDYLKLQGRFKHLFKPGNEALLEEVQQEVDRKWERLLRVCGSEA